MKTIAFILFAGVLILSSCTNHPKDDKITKRFNDLLKNMLIEASNISNTSLKDLNVNTVNYAQMSSNGLDSIKLIRIETKYIQLKQLLDIQTKQCEKILAMASQVPKGMNKNNAKESAGMISDYKSELNKHTDSAQMYIAQIQQLQDADSTISAALGEHKAASQDYYLVDYVISFAKGNRTVSDTAQTVFTKDFRIVRFDY